MERSASTKKYGICHGGEELGIAPSQSHKPQSLLCDSRQVCPSSDRAEGEWLRMKFCALTFKGTPVSLADSCLCLADRISRFSQPDVFLFMDLVLCAREPGMGLRSHFSQSEALQLRYPPLESQLLPVGAGPALFTSLFFLPVLTWLFL